MKNLLFFFGCMYFMTNVALANNYNVIVFSEQGERFWLILNGIRQNENPETNVKVTGLNAQNYKLKVIFEDKSLGELDKNLYLPDYSAEVSFSVKLNKKGEYALRYVSEVQLAEAPASPAGQQVVTFTTTAPAVSQTTTVTQQTTTTTAQPGGNVGANVDMNVGGVNMGMNVNINDNTGTGQYSSTTTTTSTTYSSTTNTAPTQAVAAGGCAGPMSTNDFNSAKSSISAKSFEDSKLTVAKQITKGNCLLADQVKDIMNLFTYEESKLDFAKFAYDYTYDKNNYYKVNDAFTYETSIDELNKFLGK